MLTIEQNQEGFKLYYKDYLFLNHSQKEPIIRIGMGTAKFKFRYGSFKIKKKLQNSVYLTRFNILEKDENRIKIEFKSAIGDVALEILTNQRDLIILP
ncbi:MAG: hypothetical protein EU548_07515, partial [Promethearchaeota archaeon]